jgi:hypothetical protein
MIDQTPADIFSSLNITKILVAILETNNFIDIPASLFMKSLEEDKELQVDYNEDNQTFRFQLKEKNGQGNNNDQLITDFE